jgi:hypothetical protein
MGEGAFHVSELISLGSDPYCSKVALVIMSRWAVSEDDTTLLI